VLFTFWTLYRTSSFGSVEGNIGQRYIVNINRRIPVIMIRVQLLLFLLTGQILLHGCHAFPSTGANENHQDLNNVTGGPEGRNYYTYSATLLIS
jgi:hypothetical protein